MSFATTIAMKPYLSYKDSRSMWLGKVPADWEVRPIRTVAQLINGATPSTAVPEYWDGNILWITPDDLGKSTGRFISSSERRITQEGYRSCGTTIAPAGSIVLSTRAPIGHIGVITSQACTNQGCRLLALKERMLSLFAFYILSAARPELESLGKGTTFSELSRGQLASFRIPLPPLDEQDAIVRYLDNTDQQIQRYIASKERLIALLEEERQALVHQAVTRGLDPNVPLKDSGVEWLGDVPEHWEIRPLKRWVSTKITDGPHETPVLLEEGIPFMSAEAMVGGRLDFNRRRGLISREQHELCCRKCSPQINDIFMCKSGATTGKVAIVDTTKEFSIWSPLALIRVDPQKVLAYLLFEVLETKYVQQQIEKHWSYGTQPNLAMNTMERIAVMLPPIAEQKKLLTYLDKATQKIVDTIARSRRQINLMNEYRTRLIADVVTGQLDVREAAAQLPAAP